MVYNCCALEAPGGKNCKNIVCLRVSHFRNYVALVSSSPEKKSSACFMPWANTWTLVLALTKALL